MDQKTLPKPPATRPLEEGNLRGTIFWFQDVGDTLPLHSHEPGQCHITICNMGKLLVYGKDHVWERVLTPGRIIKFAPHQEHAYEALEAGSKITNIIY